MSKRMRGFNKEKMEKWLKEGRGCGIKSQYKPWITIHDLASRGRSVRLHGIKTDRQHDLLSDMERDYFLILEFASEVIDIREQFPLGQELTKGIADEMGVKHPKDPETNFDIVMTTDFLITVKHKDDFIQLARTVKLKKDLMSKRQMEKFEIERRYWEKKEIDWGIVTESEIDKVFAHNISIVHSNYDISKIDSFINISQKLRSELISAFRKEIIGDNVMVREVSATFDEKMCLPPGTGLSIYKHLIITKQIKINLFSKFELDNPQTVSLIN